MSFKSKLKTAVTMGQGVLRGLPDLAPGSDPLTMFDSWYREAEESGILMPEAMTLATATSAGVPSARAVLLKGWDERGFVFFTNYGSRKARELDDNPHAALLLHWTVLERQVRIEGMVERTSEQESFDYFRTRPRGSRIGAWASEQSSELASREELERRVRETEQRFAGEDEIPLPPFWGGYRVAPRAIEFWQGRLNRLHDRITWRRTEEGWTWRRLYP